MAALNSAHRSARSRRSICGDALPSSSFVGASCLARFITMRAFIAMIRGMRAPLVSANPAHDHHRKLNWQSVCGLSPSGQAFSTCAWSILSHLSHDDDTRCINPDLITTIYQFGGYFPSRSRLIFPQTVFHLAADFVLVSSKSSLDVICTFTLLKN
jgi:hypothetical protein